MATLQCLETPQLKCKSETKFNSLRKVLPSTLVLPVSGHGMVEQIGILLWLSQRGYKPKVTFGASGGAIAAALGIAFQWNAAKWMEWMRWKHAKLIGSPNDGFYTKEIRRYRSRGRELDLFLKTIWRWPND